MIGIIYGALCCLAQTDMKRLIAFSSVAHMGFVMLGISTLTTFGINAALFGMVAHGLITGMLFFLAGSVKHRYHTLEIKRLGGMLIHDAQARLDPRLLRHGQPRPARPGRVLGRVPGDPVRLQPRLRPRREPLFRTLMVIAAVGTVFAAAYLLWLYQRTAFGTPPGYVLDDDHGGHAATPAGRATPSARPSTPTCTATTTAATRRARRDPRRHVIEWIAWTPMLVLILLLGVYPQFLFKLFDPAVTSLSTASGTSAGVVLAIAARPGGRLVRADDRLARDRARAVLIVGINIVLGTDLMVDRVAEVGRPRRSPASSCSPPACRS